MLGNFSQFFSRVVEKLVSKQLELNVEWKPILLEKGDLFDSLLELETESRVKKALEPLRSALFKKGGHLSLQSPEKQLLFSTVFMFFEMLEHLLTKTDANTLSHISELLLSTMKNIQSSEEANQELAVSLSCCLQHFLAKYMSSFPSDKGYTDTLKKTVGF